MFDLHSYLDVDCSRCENGLPIHLSALFSLVRTRNLDKRSRTLFAPSSHTKRANSTSESLGPI